MNAELWSLSATEIAAAVRDGKVSCREVVQAHLYRIQAINPSVNAVTVVLAEEALRIAEQADQAVAQGGKPGPLTGVPFTIKENIDLQGSATTQAVTALENAIAPVDAPHVAQLKAAGAIPIGRTNLPDFGLRYHTTNALRGPTINPWNASRTAEGSSGGDAAALATGMTPLGMGNDYGGSLRYPSQCCGTAALRPTFGRVTRASSLAASESPLTIQMFAVNGPMARRVSDLRLALSHMSGPDARDPWWTPAPLKGPKIKPPITVAVTVNPVNQGVDPDVEAGVRKAATALQDAGYELELTDPPSVEEASSIWSRLVMEEIEEIVQPQIRPIASEEALKFLDLSLQENKSNCAPAYIQSFAERNRIAREWSQFLEKYPIILGPVSTDPPFEVGFDIAGPESAGRVFASMRLVTTVNLLGLPSVSVPVGVSATLPQGVQIISSRYREDLCLDAAEAIERKLGTFTPIEPIT